MGTKYIDELTVILSEYSSKLTELISNYLKLTRKKRITGIFGVYGILVLLAAIYFVLDIKEYNLIVVISMSASALTIIISIFFSISLIKDAKSNSESLDEITLVMKQLEDLTKLLAQEREHSISSDNTLAKVRIDLKLTEAENIIQRAQGVLKDKLSFKVQELESELEYYGNIEALKTNYFEYEDKRISFLEMFKGIKLHLANGISINQLPRKVALILLNSEEIKKSQYIVLNNQLEDFTGILIINGLIRKDVGELTDMLYLTDKGKDFFKNVK